VTSALSTELVGIQGSPGANHEIAARQLYGADVQLAYIPTFDELFAALRSGEIDRVVTAFSNTTIARPFVEEPYMDIMSKENIGKYWIDAKTRVKVRHHLLGVPGSQLSEITGVHSMDVARDQFKHTLDSLLPRVPFINQADTALSAELVSKWGDPTQAAVASPEAGVLNRLKVLAGDIQDNPHNRTSFLSLKLGSAVTAIATGQEDRTLMLLSLGDSTRGALQRALAQLDDNDINISDIHTHSTPGSDERITQFLIEADAGFKSEGMLATLRSLGAIGCRVDVMGSWKNEPTSSGKDMPS
jgi:prephenate dehydratase